MPRCTQIRVRILQGVLLVCPLMISLLCPGIVLAAEADRLIVADSPFTQVAPARTAWPQSDAAAQQVLVRTILFVGALAAAAVTLGLAGRAWRRTTAVGKPAMIQWVGSQRVSPRASLSVYRVHQRQFLVAHDNSGIRCLLPLESFSDSLEQAALETAGRVPVDPWGGEEMPWTQQPIQRS